MESKLNNAVRYLKKEVETRCKLGKENSAKIFTEANMRRMEGAFVHSSIRTHKNYEYYEYLGDSVLKYILSFYIQKRFKNITNVNHLTKLRGHMENKSFFAGICKDMGFSQFILYDENVIKQKLNDMKRSDIEQAYEVELLSMKEDVFEAIVGVLCLVCDEIYERGVGMHLCYTFVASQLDKMKIPSTYDEIVDDITRFKELSEYVRRKGFEKEFNAEKEKFGEHKTSWHMGRMLVSHDPRPDSEERIYVTYLNMPSNFEIRPVRFEGVDKSDVRNQAAKTGIRLFQDIMSKYKIPEKPEPPVDDYRVST